MQIKRSANFMKINLFFRLHFLDSKNQNGGGKDQSYKNPARAKINKRHLGLLRLCKY